MTARSELAGFFDAGANRLFGVLTRPASEPNGTAFVVAQGGGWPMSVSRNRFAVRLCRTVAALGYHGVRFDYRGIGDSHGTIDGIRLERPFADDVCGAAAWARSYGAGRAILFGSCFGARNVMAAARDIERCAGLVLVTPPVVDGRFGEDGVRLVRSLPISGYVRRAVQPRNLRGLFDPRRRRVYRRLVRAKLTTATRREPKDRAGAGSAFCGMFEGIVRRGIPMLLIYGADDPLYEEFLEAASGPLQETLDRAGSSVRVEVLPGRVHGLGNIAVQDAVRDLVVGWLGSTDRSTTAR